MCAFSALQMSTSLVHPVLWVNKEIKVRYKDGDQQIRKMNFLVKYQLDSETIFLHQLPTTYAWCKEIQGRNQSHLPRLKTLPRNYSQTIHFSSDFVLQPPSLTLKQIYRTRCQSSSINREVQRSDLVPSFSIAVLPYWLFPTIRGPCFPKNALNISRLLYYPPLCGCYLQTCPLFHVFFLVLFLRRKSKAQIANGNKSLSPSTFRLFPFNICVYVIYFLPVSQQLFLEEDWPNIYWFWRIMRQTWVRRGFFI